MWRQSSAAWAILAAVIGALATTGSAAEPDSGVSPTTPIPGPQAKSPPKDEGKAQPGTSQPAKIPPGKSPGGKFSAGKMPGPWFGFPGAAISRSLLLGIPEVVEEIALGESQRKQLAETLRRQQTQLRSAFANVRFQEFQELSREQRDARLADLRTKVDEVNKVAEAKIAELLDAKQMARLDQLRLQREGLPAMNRPEIARQLELTEPQQEAIRKLLRESRAAFVRPVDPNAGESERRESFAKMQKLLEKTRADVLAVLTPSQQAQWKQMKGNPFVFPQPRGFGGPPRGKLPASSGVSKQAR